MSKKIYRIKETNEEVLLVKDEPMAGCTACILGHVKNPNLLGHTRCRQMPTKCTKQVFGVIVYFHFEKAF